MIKGSKKSCLRKTSCVPRPRKQVHFELVEAYSVDDEFHFLGAACQSNCVHACKVDAEFTPQLADYSIIDELEAVRIAQCWHVDLLLHNAWESLCVSHEFLPHLPKPCMPRPTLHMEHDDVWRCSVQHMPDQVEMGLKENCSFPLPFQHKLVSHDLGIQPKGRQVPCNAPETDNPEATHEPLRARPKPLFWATHPWKQHLKEALDDANIAVCNPEDETRKPTISTWFLDHVRYRRCDIPRDVQLEVDPTYWKRQIVATWEDLIDRNAGVVLHVTRPRDTLAGVHFAEVIVVQHHHPQLSSVLCTRIGHTDTTKWATILPKIGHKSAVLRSLDILASDSHASEIARFQLMIGSDTLPPDMLFPVLDGHHFKVIHSPSTDSDVDATTLFQQTISVTESVPPCHALSCRQESKPPDPVEGPALRSSSRTANGIHYFSHWQAPPTVTDRLRQQQHAQIPNEDRDLPDDHDMPPPPPDDESYLDILRRLNDATDAMPHPFIRTWYIKHRTCTMWTSPRLLEYTGSDDEFHDSVLDLWEDICAQSVDEVLISVVVPPAPAAEGTQMPLADVILSQGLDHPESAVLVSLTQGRGGPVLSHAAFSVWHHISGTDFLDMTRLADPCHQFTCTLWTGPQMLPLEGPPFETQDGQSFVVAVEGQLTPQIQNMLTFDNVQAFDTVQLTEHPAHELTQGV